MTSESRAGQATTHSIAGRRRSLALAVVAIAFVLNLLDVSIVIIAVLAGSWLLPRDAVARESTLDLAGTAWSFAAVLAWTVPSMQGPENGWSPWLLLTLAAAPLLTAGLWQHCHALQARGGAPIVRPSLLSDVGYRHGLILSLLTNGTVTAYVFALTFSWQLGAGISPTRMSLMCLPIAIGAMLGISWLGNLIFKWIGINCVLLGLTLQGAGIALMAAVTTGLLGIPASLTLSIPTLLAQALVGVGLGRVGPASTTATLNRVPRPEAGGASGVLNTVRQLSVAVLVATVTGSMKLEARQLDGASIFLAIVPVMSLALTARAWVTLRLAALTRCRGDH